MKTIMLLIIAILPVYAIGLYVYKKDREKEPKKLLIKLFILGIISCIPAAILEITIDSFFPAMENLNLINLAIYIFISIALIEEICKWFMVYKFSYNNNAFNHLYDAIVYSVFVSLGFAALENILYVVSTDINTGLLRAISAIPGHACYGIIMGYYLGLSKIANINLNNKLAKKNLHLSILIPALVHTAYNFCLFTNIDLFIILFAIIVLIIYIYGIKTIKKISKDTKQF